MEKISLKTEKTANKEDMEYRYRRAYELHVSKLSEGMKARVLAVKGNADRDGQVEKIIKDIIELAESDKEI